jgi:hypothetical protein
MNFFINLMAALSVVGTLIAALVSEPVTENGPAEVVTIQRVAK